MRRLLAPEALLPEGWCSNVRVEIDSSGRISDIQPNAEHTSDTERLSGWLLPGMSNCHSHAWQRALVGLTEGRIPGKDDFWGWREVMYEFLDRIGPEDLQSIAAQVYLEMIQAGYTSVGEFHYLHHDRRGHPYADPAEMSQRIIAAAEQAGIGLTLLPVLYRYGDFGARPPDPGQRRFIHDAESFLTLVERLKSLPNPSLQLGIAPHSLRAVDESLLRETLTGAARLLPDAPIHLHIAEQTREVDRCVAATGQRPVRWLFEHFDVDGRWCLVHATHMSRAEIETLARSRAVAGVCPTTEANLGDGVFPAEAYLALEGQLAVGSDSQMSVDPVAECRLLEYAQRLISQRRGLLASAAHPNPGDHLFIRACEGGVQALGRAAGRIQVGRQADLIVLDDTDPVLWGKHPQQRLDSWIFGTQRPVVKDVMVGGQWCIRNTHHPAEEQVRINFQHTMKKLLI